MEVFEQLVEHVESSDLADDDKTSLLNSLRPLRHESINRSGQLFAAGKLGDRTYMDNPPESPAQFFKKSYGVRSNLVHRNEPQPDRRVVIERGLYLEGFVSHVLASALDDFDPRAAPPDAAPDPAGAAGVPDAGDAELAHGTSRSGGVTPRGQGPVAFMRSGALGLTRFVTRRR
jgi:hypothetical protein